MTRLIKKRSADYQNGNLRVCLYIYIYICIYNFIIFYLFIILKNCFIPTNSKPMNCYLPLDRDHRRSHPRGMQAHNYICTMYGKRRCVAARAFNIGKFLFSVVVSIINVSRTNQHNSGTSGFCRKKNVNRLVVTISHDDKGRARKYFNSNAHTVFTRHS